MFHLYFLLKKKIGKKKKKKKPMMFKNLYILREVNNLKLKEIFALDTKTELLNTDDVR